MWLKNYPVELSGTLKMSKRQAKELFNFDLKMGAKGITFCRVRAGKIYMKNYYPSSHIVNTKERKARSHIFSILSKIGSAHMDDLIHPVWDPIAKKKNYLGGFHLFMATNMRLLTNSKSK
ncbi:MAG: hypothetical protein QMD71_08075 [bacterium]|nr:hypothetical protein [bacterium]